MTDNIIRFPISKEDLPPNEVERLETNKPDWSVRRVAAEVLSEDEAWLNAAAAVAGAFAVKSIVSAEKGKWLLIEGDDKSPLDIIKILAQDIMNEEDIHLDEQVSYFNAMGMFAWEFVERCCVEGGRNDVI